ncbi:unnamed protein product [Trifolium pratense]|uniref:Uncharacterized protein n=1 Tax=Trifolium pratense TaxID=57577 RepID=A0ACB0JVS7_TRIPR|nr:unnamed protein product [Trifolium pratense]
MISLKRLGVRSALPNNGHCHALQQFCELHVRHLLRNKKSSHQNQLGLSFRFRFTISDKDFIATPRKKKMIDDEALGFIANFLGIFIFALVIAYHLVIADPKYEAN